MCDGPKSICGQDENNLRYYKAKNVLMPNLARKT